MSKGHRFNVGDIVTLKPGVSKYRVTGQGERFSVDGSCFMYADALME